jgi:hypothetical protein
MLSAVAMLLMAPRARRMESEGIMNGVRACMECEDVGLLLDTWCAVLDLFAKGLLWWFADICAVQRLLSLIAELP